MILIPIIAKYRTIKVTGSSFFSKYGIKKITSLKEIISH